MQIRIKIDGATQSAEFFGSGVKFFFEIVQVGHIKQNTVGNQPLVFVEDFDPGAHQVIGKHFVMHGADQSLVEFLVHAKCMESA